MPQSDRRGRGGSDPGPGAAPDPDTDPRSIHPEPPPEAPLGEVPAAAPDEPAEPPAAESMPIAPDEAAPATLAEGGPEEETERTEEDVLAELEEAQAGVDQLERELAILREESRRKDELDRRVAQYQAQYDGLKTSRDSLTLFRTAEITFLETMLPDDAPGAIAAVEPGLRAEADDLALEAEDAAAKVEAQRRDLDAARETEAAARREVERLAAPAEPIRAKLKEAAALRTAANEAEEQGDYALAYWIVMDGGRLQQRLEDEELLDPETLAARIEEAQQAAADARADVTRLEAPLADLTRARDEARAARDEADATLEARVLKHVSLFNSSPDEPA